MGGTEYMQLPAGSLNVHRVGGASIVDALLALIAHMGVVFQ